MNVKVLFFIQILPFLFIQLNGLTIEIEPDELNQVSEILQAFINNHSQQQTYHPLRRSLIKRVIFPLLKTFLRNIVQMFGIMMTLVGANLLSVKWEPMAMGGVNVNNTSISTSDLITATEMCNSDNDYGCNQNQCWRTCDLDSSDSIKSGKIDSISWCYTYSSVNKGNFKNCDSSEDCSPCWDCLTSCTDSYK